MDFRTAALTLRPYIRDAFMLTDAADAIVSASPTGSVTVVDIPHRFLVQIAIGNPVIMDAMTYGSRINAIKELRRITGAGLKATKEATEDALVTNEVNLKKLRDKLNA